jgi:hypothetical protein
MLKGPRTNVGRFCLHYRFSVTTGSRYELDTITSLIAFIILFVWPSQIFQACLVHAFATWWFV